MTAEQLRAGYEWCYRRLFSHSSIWRRRPSDWRAVLPYIAMSYLYKRSNLLWHLLIRYRMTAWVWRPLIEIIYEQNEDLLRWNPSILERYYERETLGSELARRVFVMPDSSRAHGAPPVPSRP